MVLGPANTSSTSFFLKTFKVGGRASINAESASLVSFSCNWSRSNQVVVALEGMGWFVALEGMGWFVNPLRMMIMAMIFRYSFDFLSIPSQRPIASTLCWYFCSFPSHQCLPHDHFACVLYLEISSFIYWTSLSDCLHVPSLYLCTKRGESGAIG